MSYVICLIIYCVITYNIIICITVLYNFAVREKSPADMRSEARLCIENIPLTENQRFDVYSKEYYSKLISRKQGSAQCTRTAKSI
jgi:hypothetical protein